MKFHPAIKVLADVIYSIRPSEGSPFNPGYALDQVAAELASLGANCLSKQAKDFDASLRTWCDAPVWQRLIQSDISEKKSMQVVRAFAMATREHAPFTDLLALAGECLKQHYGSGFPELFLSRIDRKKLASAAIGYQAAGSDRMLGLMDPRAGSLALATLSGLHRNPNKLAHSKASLFLASDDERSLRVTAAQVLLALTHFPHYIGYIHLALVADDGVHLALGIGSVSPMREVA